MASIPIDVLRAFVAVVEARGFTRAAEELGRTQPTVSLQVKRLEEIVEAPLFERAARITLSEAGKACFDYGRRILTLHDALIEEAGRRKAGARLRLGAPGEWAARLAPRLAEARAAGLSLDVTIEPSEALLATFRAGGLDVALVLAAGPIEGALEQRRAPLRWMARRGFAPAPDKPLPLACAAEGSALRETAVAALRKAGRAYEIVCRSADAQVLRAAVIGGIAVAATVEGWLGDEAAALPPEAIAPLPALNLALLARTPALADAARRITRGLIAGDPATKGAAG